MAYTLVDLLEKLRAIGETSARIYEDAANIYEVMDRKISFAAKVLKAEELRHVERYSVLIKDAAQRTDTEIDFDVYDKVYSLMNEFKKRIIIPNVSTVLDLMVFAYEFEKSVSALLLDIRGRMVRDSNDVANYNYLIITELILEQQNHTSDIASFVK